MTICVIHTGGTIGMAATPGGFAPKEGVVEAELKRLHDSREIQSDYIVVTAAL